MDCIILNHNYNKMSKMTVRTYIQYSVLEFVVKHARSYILNYKYTNLRTLGRQQVSHQIYLKLLVMI